MAQPNSFASYITALFTKTSDMRYFILSFYIFKFLNHNIFITFYKVSITFRSDNESNAKEEKDNWARHYHVMQGLTNEQLREKLTRWVEELKDIWKPTIIKNANL